MWSDTGRGVCNNLAVISTAMQKHVNVLTGTHREEEKKGPPLLINTNPVPLADVTIMRAGAQRKALRPGVNRPPATSALHIINPFLVTEKSIRLNIRQFANKAEIGDQFRNCERGRCCAGYLKLSHC